MKNLRFLAFVASLCALALSFSSCSKDDEPTNVFELPALESTTLKMSYVWKSFDSKSRLMLDFNAKTLLYQVPNLTTRHFLPFDYEVDTKTRELKLMMLNQADYAAWTPPVKGTLEKAEEFKAINPGYSKVDYEVAQEILSKVKRIELSRGLTEICFEGWVPFLSEGTTDVFVLKELIR